MKYKFNLSTVAHQRKGLMYFYDRCFFLKLLSTRKKGVCKSFIVPKNVYPSLGIGFSLNNLMKSTLYISTQESGILFYRLALEALGVANVNSFVKMVTKDYQNYFFNVFCTKQLENCFSFDYLGSVSVVLRTAALVLNPVYTIQSFLYQTKYHSTGFCLFGNRLDSFGYLKWFDLVQSLFGLSDLHVNLNVRYNRWLLRVLFLALAKKNTGKPSCLPAFLSTFVGIHPKYFNYTKITSGLSFKIIYTNQVRVRFLF